MIMHLRGFLQAGHTPTLACAFLYFDISFMVWVLLGALANSIAPELELDAAARGVMVAVPLLGGAILRLVLGVMTDHIGARRTALCGLLLTVIPLLLGWLWAEDFSDVLLVGLLLGVAGASFAAALPLASRWYPPRYQGLVLGIAGAGNVGTALSTFFGSCPPSSTPPRSRRRWRATSARPCPPSSAPGWRRPGAGMRRSASRWSRCSRPWPWSRSWPRTGRRIPHRRRLPTTRRC